MKETDIIFVNLMRRIIFIFSFAFIFCSKHSSASQIKNISNADFAVESENLFFSNDSQATDSYSDDDLSDNIDDDINNEVKKKLSLGNNSTNTAIIFTSIYLPGNRFYNIFFSANLFYPSSRSFLELSIFRL